MYGSSSVVALINTLSCVTGQASTYRGLYHLVVGLTWAWRLSVLSVSVTAKDYIFLALTSSAFLFDVFHSHYPPTYPPELSTLSLSERLSYNWVSQIVGSIASPDLDCLPEVTFPGSFEGYIERLFTLNDRDASPIFNMFWGFIIRDHLQQLALGSILRLVDDLSKFSLPWLLRSLLARPTIWNVALLFFSRVIGALCGNYSGYCLRVVSAHYKAALSSALHLKALRLGDLDTSSSQGPDISTLCEVDSQILYRSSQQILDVWSFPLQILLCLGGVAVLLPWPALIAVILIILVVFPMTSFFLKLMGRWVVRNMSAKDRRTKLIVEALEVIQSIKMQGWESIFVQSIAEQRRAELTTVEGMAISQAGLVCVMQGLPSLLTLASLGTMFFLGSSMTIELVFALLMLFTLLNTSLMQISGLASTLQSIVASSTRIQSYLRLPETKLDGLRAVEPHLWGRQLPMRFKCERSGWPGSEPLFSSGELNIAPGSLSVLTGEMGSGKSTLLFSILRCVEKYKLSDSNTIQLAYIPQKPVLIGGTLRENILLGKPFNPEWYSKVINACCLDFDFARLKDGDNTSVVGGSTLSGGQIARVILARAAYARADMYLLDDPLAALDASVSSRIIERLLGPQGLLAGSIRIICTANKSLHSRANQLLCLVGGELQTQAGQEHSSEDLLDLNSSATQEDSAIIQQSTQDRVLDVVEPGQATNTNNPSSLSLDVLQKDSSQKSPILTYILSAKRSSWVTTIFILLMARVCSTLSTYVLKILATEQDRYWLLWDLGAYALFSVLQIAFFFLFIMLLYKLCIVPASARLHQNLTESILSQSMAFFQTTPIGELLNLFTNDIARIDGSLNTGIATLMGQYTNLLLACALMVISMPASIVLVILLLVISYRLQLVYLDTLRHLRRLDVSSRAPLLEYLQEADKSRVSFSVYNFTQARLTQFHDQLEVNLRALFPLSCLELWLGIRLEVMTVLLQVAALGFMLQSGLDSGTVGFVMTYVFQTVTTFSIITKVSAQCETDAVSVSRIEQYATMTDTKEIWTLDMPSQGYRDDDPVASWPQAGKIEFKSASLRHRPGLPICLDSLSLTIQPGEKVAVVGRTGAGKSSLALSLLRMMDLTSGEILIDSTNIATVSLECLRSSVAVMPQAQTVLSGTVRKNLDPLGVHEDERILRCLEICGATDIINKLITSEKNSPAAAENSENSVSSILDVIIQGSSSLSKGEMQLLSLARAMLRDSKVLVLDEATSGMDLSTETGVHETMFSKMVDTTILAVMHRLDLTVSNFQLTRLNHLEPTVF